MRLPRYMIAGAPRDERSNEATAATAIAKKKSFKRVRVTRRNPIEIDTFSLLSKISPSVLEDTR